MDNDMLRIIGLIVVIGYIIYLILGAVKIQTNVLEGLVGSMNGEGGSSEKYLSSLNEEIIKLQDTLLIDKYRDQYDSVTKSLDEYLTLMMLKKSLHIDPQADEKKNMQSFTDLNNLYQAKVAVEQLKHDMENNL
jgi:hypothetical protein